MWPAPVSWRAAMPCQTVVLTQFLGPEDSAMLRLSADVFILAIRTDAFSASMQEYLYAGACVLKGAWLGYPQLEDMGIELNPSATLPIYPRWWRAPWTERSPPLRPGSARSSPASTPGRPCGRAGCPSTADYLPPMGRPSACSAIRWRGCTSGAAVPFSCVCTRNRAS